MPARIAEAWNGWFHVNGNTYGTWIRGDARGWRARHHREHVEGDYRNRPEPGRYAREEALSKELMEDPVRLDMQARKVACEGIVESLIHHGAEVIACAVDDHHFHVLARFVLPEKDPTGSHPWASGKTRNQPIYGYIRHIFGLAKSRSARAVSEQQVANTGGVWGKRFKITAIMDRAHQVAVFKYILRHVEQGAVVWTFRDRDWGQGEDAGG